MVASSLVEKLLNTPLSSQESLMSLNKFMSTFDEGVSVLKSLRVPDLGDFILFMLASRCLPSSCRTLFESNNYDDYPSVEALFTFVKSRITVWSMLVKLLLVVLCPRYDPRGRIPESHISREVSRPW